VVVQVGVWHRAVAKVQREDPSSGSRLHDRLHRICRHHARRLHVICICEQVGRRWPGGKDTGLGIGIFGIVVSRKSWRPRRWAVLALASSSNRLAMVYRTVVLPEPA